MARRSFAGSAKLIAEVVDGLAANGEEGNGAVEARVRREVRDLTARFPIYIVTGCTRRSGGARSCAARSAASSKVR